MLQGEEKNRSDQEGCEQFLHLFIKPRALYRECLGGLGPLYGVTVGAELDRIVERSQIGLTETAGQGPAEQLIGEVRVLGQERAVAVGAQEVLVDQPLGSALPVVAVAAADPGEGGGAWIQEGLAAVVFEPNDRFGLKRQGEFSYQVPDQPPGSGDGVGGEDPEAFNPLVRVRLKIASEELIAAADEESRQPIAGGRCEIGLMAQEILGDQGLAAVLAAAEKDDIGRGPVHDISDSRVLYLKFYSSPCASSFEGLDIAEVAVEVHLVGVEMDEAELHQSVSRRCFR